MNIARKGDLRVGIDNGNSETMWRFWVDRGGTFTDLVASHDGGPLRSLKLLSEDPLHYADAVVEGMRRLSGTPQGPLPPSELRLGTTVATNALLERKGEPVLLAITRGFGDALTIGTQERPDIFARAIVRPEQLQGATVEIDERMMADGSVLHALDEDQARNVLTAAFAIGLRAVAIALLHGWQHPAHEEALAKIAQEIGFTCIRASHKVAARIGLIARAQTTVADAYLSPVLARHIERLQASLGPAVTCLFMQSNGGLASASSFYGKDAILSGPAGGIVGMGRAAMQAGFDNVIGFDMGGTSTDVSCLAGRHERVDETTIAGVRIRTPMLGIHTVAAGGGSICHFEEGRLLVGPQSAGALPGPACYGRGGPLTITDCNLLLGRVRSEDLPAVFGEHGDSMLDLAAARERIAALCDEVAAHTGTRPAEAEVANGFLTIAVTSMANAIKSITQARGQDASRAAMVCFGGAGGQLACRVAEALGVTSVLFHPLASVLSAYGIGLADRRAIRETTLDLRLDATNLSRIEETARRLATQAADDLVGQGVERASIREEWGLLVCPERNSNALEVPWGELAAMRADFAEAWHRRFGFKPEGELVADGLRVQAIYETAAPALDLATDEAVPFALDKCEPGEVPVVQRANLGKGTSFMGPALVVDASTTIVVEPGWQGRIQADGSLVLTRDESARAPLGGAERDPVRLEVMGALFMAVAEEMGAALQRSAHSVNIRERLDFSCAVFDQQGQLVANAPHIPVHLGSMSDSVRAIIARRAADGRGMLPGDAYAMNEPYLGGTHLPDITVVMPVFVAADAHPAWYVAARGHHTDIGGISPGSMPPDSRDIAEEGVVIDNMLLVDRGRLCEAQMRALLGAGPWPARDPDRNLADLKAQLAACTRGASELLRLAQEQGRDVIDAYMAHLQDHAEHAVRRLLMRLDDAKYSVETDKGATIAVAISIDREAQAARIDFTGSSRQRADNMNAPLAVVRATVIYAVRCLIDDGVPMNEGYLRPLTLIVPAGSMLNPQPPAAVVAGNVETSQILCDALFAAFGAMAASQGTMNNFTFGDATHQYYETIAGGSGAGPGFAGASTVQTHMTNSRLTDPEVLETNFPVLLEEFAIRRGSGGRGRWSGGDGAVRRLRFLAPMQAGILSDRRRTVPFGIAGGQAGLPGANRIERADGRVEVLDGTASALMGAGDVFVIETPGGGGYGEPD